MTSSICKQCQKEDNCLFLKQAIERGKTKGYTVTFTACKHHAPVVKVRKAKKED